MIIASSADELIRRLRFDDLTADEFKAVLAEYNTLHSNAVGRFPNGTGIGKALETFRAATGKSVNGGGISERPAEQNPRN